MMKKLIYPQDIYDLNKNKTENPFCAPMHEKPNNNFEKAQTEQTLETIHLRRRHLLGGEGSKICRWIVVKNYQR